MDKLSKLFPGIVILALIARHLGPEPFGIWNYGLALTTIVGSLATLGMDKIAVNELINNQQNEGVIVNTLIFMRLVAGLACLLISVGFVLVTKKADALYLYCTLFSALNIVLQSFDVLDYFYQVQHRLKRTILPKVSVFLIFCVVKLVIVLMGGGLLAFLWASFLELLVTYGVIATRYQLKHDAPRTLKIDLALASSLLQKSWPLIFSNLVVVLFVKVDLMLLDALASPAQLGEYVSAARISELWYAIPTVISVAMLPSLITKRNNSKKGYLQTLEKWLRLSFWSSLCIAIGMVFVAPVIIPFLYGTRYAAASQILMIHIWASIPVFLNAAFVQYMFIEGAYKMYLYGNTCGLVVNVGLNLWLIPRYGGTGAAIATVAAYSTVYCMMVVLDKSGQGRVLTRKIFHPGLLWSDIRQVYDNLRIFIAGLLSIPQKASTE